MHKTLIIALLLTTPAAVLSAKQSKIGSTPAAASTKSSALKLKFSSLNIITRTNSANKEIECASIEFDNESIADIHGVGGSLQIIDDKNQIVYSEALNLHRSPDILWETTKKKINLGIGYSTGIKNIEIKYGKYAGKKLYDVIKSNPKKFSARFDATIVE